MGARGLVEDGHDVDIHGRRLRDENSQPSVVRVIYTWAFERSFSAELYLGIVFSPDAGALTEARRCIPKKLLDQIHMSHDHSATAVSPTTQLIHGISKKPSADFHAHLFSPHIPVRYTIVEKLKVALP